MRCEEIHAHLADHLAGTLPPDVAAQVADHLRGCPTCAAEVDGLQDTWQMLGTIAPHTADATAMRSRFAATLDGYQGGLTTPTPTRRSSWPGTYGWHLAAAAAVLMLGIAIGRQTAPAPPDPQLTLLRDELKDMRQMVTL